ncbi:UBN2 domain-containing protein [Salix suchowensis]|nr:UBN2 domain-containing protein [Salix suchowensis]
MTIQEVIDLTKLSLKKLIDSLMTHGITMKNQELEEKPKKNLAFKTIHHQGSKKFVNSKKMKIRKNLAKRHLDATSQTRQDILRLIALFFKTRKRTVNTN